MHYFATTKTLNDLHLRYDQLVQMDAPTYVLEAYKTFLYSCREVRTTGQGWSSIFGHGVPDDLHLLLPDGFFLSEEELDLFVENCRRFPDGEVFGTLMFTHGGIDWSAHPLQQEVTSICELVQYCIDDLCEFNLAILRTHYETYEGWVPPSENLTPKELIDTCLAEYVPLFAVSDRFFQRTGLSERRFLRDVEQLDKTWISRFRNADVEVELFWPEHRKNTQCLTHGANYFRLCPDLPLDWRARLSEDEFWSALCSER